MKTLPMLKPASASHKTTAKRNPMQLYLAIFVFLSLVADGVSRAAAQTLSPDFREEVVFSGLVEPTAMEFASDGRVFVAEKSGLIKVFSSLTATVATVFADLRTKVHSFWDRGLLGMTLHPNFPTIPYLYVLYAHDAAIGGTAPRWGTVDGTFDDCPTPPGPTTDGCVVSGRLSRLEAAGNVMVGTETVLLEGWCQQFPSHSMGALAFGADGALYVSAGEGAHFDFVDYGQIGNPCGDPPTSTQTPPTAEGGALRSQSLERPAGEPALLNGSILRLDPNTGNGLPDNPLASSSDAIRRRIVAYGLRNPYRFTIRPDTSEVWIGDVGMGLWEEINLIVNPNAGVLNFGWPCYEGQGRQPGYDSANLNICESIYTRPGAVTPPYFSYAHRTPIVAGENCPSGSSSITGLAFYNGGNYPPEYAGALFFADYARGCIWTIFNPAGDAGGTPTSPMAFVSPDWRGNETYLVLAANEGHPGNAADAIRRWKAPQAGNINITGRAFDLDGNCGSGVSVSIRKNGTNLWQEVIANGNTTGFTFNLMTAVVTGDNVDFVINRGADNSNACDATAFDPTIIFTPAANPTVPETYLASADFSSTQGFRNWYYLQSSQAAQGAMVDTLVEQASSPVQLKIGPNGDLFYVDFNGGTVRRIRYGTNRAPIALPQATPSSGPAPLTVNFNGSASSDPDVGDTITYAWDLNGDGQIDDSTQPNPVFTYNADGSYVARLRVTDNNGASSTASVVITVGIPNTPPAVEIVSPLPTTTWKVGDTIPLIGQASDLEDGGALPDTALSWKLIMHHCPASCHTHPMTNPQDNFFIAPDHEYPSHMEVQLTATDSRGATNTKSVLIFPQTAALNFQTIPTGLQLAVGGSASVAPFSRTVIIGSANSISATTPQALGGANYQFVSWSDSQAQTHNITAGAVPATYTATYQSTTTVAFPTSTTILTGTLNGGNAAALTSDNNVYFAVNSTTSGTRTTAWYGSFSAVPSTLSNLRVNYRGNNSANCTQTVGIWRWSDSTWVQLDSRSVSSTEIAINNLAPSGTLADYVSGSGELRVRVRCTRTANFIARGELMSISYDAPVGPPPPDTTAPVRSNGAPSGTLAFGTTQTTLSLTTNENASCRYATSAGVNYDSMAVNGFTATGGTAHSSVVSGLVNGGSYNFFVRCRDASSNANTNGDDYPISFTVSSQATQSFQASVDFSTTQGFRNWSYLYGTATQMVFASPNWQGNETYLLLYPDGGHPGNSADAIRRWRAPQAGTINITGSAFDQDGSCGSGVSVSIRKNGTNLWQQAIANGNATGFNFNLTTTVVTGDNIDFVINRGADNANSCDATGFNPTILLTP